jgi:hypothetical protein
MIHNARQRVQGRKRRICTLVPVFYRMVDACIAWWMPAPRRGEAPMTIKHASAVAAATICLAAAMARPAACADDYPSRPITMVVPLAPVG